MPYPVAHNAPASIYSEGIGCNSHNTSNAVNFSLLTQVKRSLSLCKDPACTETQFYPTNGIELRKLWPEVELSAAVRINGLIGVNVQPALLEKTTLWRENVDFV